MRLCVFEDATVGRLEPLTLTRPACDLRCGASSLLERQCRYFGATEVGLLVRPLLADWCRFLHPGRPVNDVAWLHGGNTLLVNARWVPPAERPIDAPDILQAGLIGNEIAYLWMSSREWADCPLAQVAERIAALKTTSRHGQAGGRLIAHPWDLVEQNPASLDSDYLHWRALGVPSATGLTITGPAEYCLLAPSARVEPLVHIDTTKGPVLIDEEAVVQSFSRLQGPCYVGVGTRIRGARLSGSSIGPCCRVGGEVEASIFQGYANKAHEGFLGHSYIGEWVNLGAGTQVSDLRNDYAPERVSIVGEDVDTGLLKVGAFLGDHTKTGLGTLLNSGTVVGAFCHLLPWATLLPKVIPSFCAFWLGQLQEQADFRQLFGAAAAVLRRRGALWTDRHAEFFLALYEQTARQRRVVLYPNALQRARRNALL
jgi:UDP-N-acetylglucosamine diphosphorylase/glucosamine-1-phosphate N-acetyltransferase